MSRDLPTRDEAYPGNGLKRKLRIAGETPSVTVASELQGLREMDAPARNLAWCVEIRPYERWLALYPDSAESCARNCSLLDPAFADADSSKSRESRFDGCAD